MPNGLKPSEAFFSDISNNMVRWAYSGSELDLVLYYETKQYWYRFELEDTDVGRMGGIIWIRRFERDSPKEITIFVRDEQIHSMRAKWKFNTTSKNMVPVK